MVLACGDGLIFADDGVYFYGILLDETELLEALDERQHNPIPTETNQTPDNDA